MKHILLAIVAFSIIYIPVYAQTRDAEYIFKYSTVEVDKYDLSSKSKAPDDNKTYLGLKGSRIIVTSINEDLVVFQLVGLNRTDKRNTPAIDIHYLDSSDSWSFFCMEKDRFNAECTDKFIDASSVYVDAIVLPFKFRFSNKQGGEFDFTQSISVGGAYSISLGKSNISSTYSENSYSLIIGLNATNVSVDEKTVPSVLTSKSTALGITPIFGFNLVRGKISLGALTGLDILTGKAGRSWVYRKSPWVGLSIGTSIVSIVK